MNQLQEGQPQQTVIMPPPIWSQPNTTVAQNSVVYHSTTIPGRAGKTKEVAKDLSDPIGGMFEGNPIQPLYACVQVLQIINSSYDDHEIDIPSTDVKHFLGAHVGSTI